MPRTPITVVLFRCNNCHAVYATEADTVRKDGRLVRPPSECACGGSGWTRIRGVI